MTKTENLQLPQWEATDYVQRNDFNAAFAALDEGYSTAMAAAAQVTASLGNKADVATVEAAVEALAAQHSSDVAKLGNCRIVTGNYTGTGEFGKSHPVTLTFDAPLLLLILNSTIFSKTAGGMINSNAALVLSWKENTISWYNSSSATTQFNASDTTYSYLALLAQSD
jgi:hypothetical protein